ncbi:MAG: class I SAM-dependent methyltransferase [Minwuia sp.]|nr:class I SAM-dependent methyltransferase [Minwuia sp.]
MAEATLNGTPQGWFIPYRHAAEVVAPPAAPAVAYPALAALLDAAREDSLATLAMINACRDDLLAISATDDTARPRWLQDWFGGLDAATAYSMVRHHRPARIVEVGSGHSTRFMKRAADDGGFTTDILAIDPAPRADIRDLGIRIQQTVVQDAPADSFAHLVAGDILAIDSSHILMPGSDVDHLLNTVIPGLPAGVIVHIHDIFLPGGYPESWLLRGYNEQNGVAALLAGGRLRPLLGCRHALDHMTDDVARLAGFIPRPVPVLESSLWSVTT